jgi:hypothetical protein
VALGEEADEHALEHLVLAGDDAPDLEQRLLEPLAPLSWFHVRLPVDCWVLKFASSPKFWMR